MPSSPRLLGIGSPKFPGQPKCLTGRPPRVPPDHTRWGPFRASPAAPSRPARGVDAAGAPRPHVPRDTRAPPCSHEAMCNAGDTQTLIEFANNHARTRQRAMWATRKHRPISPTTYLQAPETKYHMFCHTQACGPPQISSSRLMRHFPKPIATLMLVRWRFSPQAFPTPGRGLHLEEGMVVTTVQGEGPSHLRRRVGIVSTTIGPTSALIQGQSL